MNARILITGAAGKTGRAVIAALTKREALIRALVRDEKQAAALRSLGAAETIAGNMTLPEDVKRAALGIDRIYHIPPNMHPDEVAIGENVIRAARDTGVRRVVYHSVLKPQTRKMPHHWNKLRVEELLLESGLEHAVLQPTAYMQNILAGWDSIVQHGRYRVPYPAATRLSLVDLEDVAEAAARVLLGDSFAYGSYELAGTAPLTQTEVAAALGETLGREVVVEEVALETWREQAAQAGMTPYATDTLSAMFVYYNQAGLGSSPFTLQALLGRSPTTLVDFLMREIQHRG